jgi:hypothetical protein
MDLMVCWFGNLMRKAISMHQTQLFFKILLAAKKASNNIQLTNEDDLSLENHHQSSNFQIIKSIENVTYCNFQTCKLLVG